MKVRELLSDESKWTQGSYARDAAGRSVQADDPSAVRWCLLGALHYCFAPAILDDDDAALGAARRIKQALGVTCGEEVASWQDQAEFAEVKALVDRLDI